MILDIQEMLGKTEHQPYFDRMYHTALQGMNIGGGDEVGQSGELLVLLSLKNQFDLAHRHPIVFDVGANIGMYSLAVSMVFKENVELYSFEPSKFTFNLLMESSLKFPHAHLFNLGFSELDGKRTLYYNEPGSGMSSVHKRQLDHIGVHFEQSEQISMSTLDGFCNEHTIPQIDFLKLDVEGHELSVLSGARKMIDSNRIQYIQFEFGGTNIDSRTYFRDFFYLLNERYSLFRIVKDGLQPIPVYRETYEIFTTTNFLAIHR